MAEDNMTLGYLMGQSEGNNNGGFGGLGDGWLGLILFAMIFGWNGNGGGLFGGGGGGRGIADGFALQNITGGISGLERGIADSTYALSSQLAQCCCDNRAATADLKYTIANEFCGLGNTVQNGFRDVIDNQNAGTRAVLDFLVQDKIATLTAENQSLKFAASQAQQNAFITANQEAQTAELIRRIAPVPVPSYTVPAPYPYGYGGYNGGCGCGC